MYDCINEAFEYLKNKYGYKRSSLTGLSYERLSKARNKKERIEIENSFTDRNYILKINPITEKRDIHIELLIGQYYYGIQAKKELYYLLISMGIIDNK